MAVLKDFILVVDLDKTLCTLRKNNESYRDVKPIEDIVNVVNDLHELGVNVMIESSRNMLTQNHNEAKVIKNIGLDTLNWLDKYVEYDGIKFGKTIGTCYIDDKALRPKEFMSIYNSLEDKTDTIELENRIKKYLEEN